MLTKPIHRKHSVSERESDDFTIKCITANDFTKGIDSFISENMRGAICVEREDMLTGYLDIAPYGFSFFLKLLLNEIYGSGLVKLSIYSTDKKLYMKADFGNILLPERIISVAERSGFSIVRSDFGLIELSAGIRFFDNMSIYAIDAKEFGRYLVEIFFM